MNIHLSEEQILTSLNQSQLFSQFDRALLLSLIELCHVQQFQVGEIIISEGITNEKVYVLIDGAVIVHQNGEEIISLNRQGDLIGEMSVISKKQTVAQVSAKTIVTLFTISNTDIRSSGSIDLERLLDKVFLDVLTYKLTKTTNKAKNFEVNKRELANTQVELAVSEDQLNTQTSILNNVFASMSDGVVILDKGQGLLRANHAFQQMVRVEVSADTRQWPSQLGIYSGPEQTVLTPEDIPFLNTETVQKQAWDFYIQNPLLPEGRWLSAQASQIEGTEVGGSVIVFRDTTKQKLEEQALIQAKEEAEKTAEAKSNFLAVMSHELKTPLNSIIGMSEILSDGDLNHEQKDLLHTLRSSGESLLAMVQNILDLNQLEAGQYKNAQLMPIALSPVLEKTYDTLLPFAQSKNLSFVLKVDNAVGVMVNASDNIVFQILKNLVHNAIKFTKEGGVSIEIQCNEEQKKIQINILDTGIGLGPAAQKNLFKPFFLEDVSFSRAQDGIGIGAALAFKFTECLHGTLTYQPRPEGGSCFQITLPIQQAKSMPEAAKQNSTPGSPPATPTAKPGPDVAAKYPIEILVVEDNAANQKLIGVVLKRLGYKPDFAGNGEIGLQMSKEKQYGLILMDLQMPVMDGVTSAKHILEDNPSPPAIIALTANTTAGTQETCLEAGMVDYLTKPLRIQELAVKIATWSPITKE